MLISKISTPFQRNDNNSTRNQGVTYPKLSTLSSDTVSFSGIKPIKPVKHCRFCSVSLEELKAGDLKKIVRSFLHDKSANALEIAAQKMAAIKYSYTKENFPKIEEKIKKAFPKEIQELMQCRIKDFESMKDKIIKRYNELPETISPEKRLLRAFGKVNDSMGVRINLRPNDLSEASIMRLLKSFKNNNSFPITQIDNYHGIHTKPYIRHSKLQGLKTSAKIKTASKESGYKALQINLGDEIEIQIKSARLTAFGDWEHDVKYKSKGNSGPAYKDLGEEEQKAYRAYLVKCYDYISKLDNNVKKAKEPAFPEGLDEILKYKNFDAGKKSTENLEKTRLDNL